MDVFEFEKSLIDRLGESMDVLSECMLKPSQIRNEWAFYIELQIEPTGWNALWKIPRVICEDLKLRFPTVVFGMVQQILFKELKAVFMIQAVQDDDVHLPEQQLVNLEDLWVTKVQENPELMVEKTADLVDRLRFFYTQVWMPWDNDSDDDLDWVERHLESRIRFCYDLNRKEMNRSLVAHIRTLLEEAKYIQQKREYMEIGLTDDEEVDSTLDKTQITDLMRLHLRLAMIKNEIELLENPEMRKIYEDTNYNDEKESDSLQKITEKKHITYIVTTPSKIEDQILFLSIVKKLLTHDNPVHMCPSLLDVLKICNESDDIFLPPGKHRMKFLQCLKENGTITGVTEYCAIKNSNESRSKNEVVIMSSDDDSNLLVFDGNYMVKNTTFDCQNIRTGILIKTGIVKLTNCRLIGNGRSSTQQGVVCTKNSNLIMENCIIENFATAFLMCDAASVTLKNCKISNCRIGFDVEDSRASLSFEKTQISCSTKCGIYFETSLLDNKIDVGRILLKQLADVQNRITVALPWSGDCSFQDCAANIFILNKKIGTAIPKSLDSIINETDDSNIKSKRRALEFNENSAIEVKSGDNSDVIIIDDSVIEMKDVE